MARKKKGKTVTVDPSSRPSTEAARLAYEQGVLNGIDATDRLMESVAEEYAVLAINAGWLEARARLRVLLDAADKAVEWRRQQQDAHTLCLDMLKVMPVGLPVRWLFRLPGEQGWATLARLADHDGQPLYTVLPLGQRQGRVVTAEQAAALVVDGTWSAAHDDHTHVTEAEEA